MIPVAVQNASLKTYPLTTFVDGVFDPVTKEVMDDITENAKIENHQFSYAGQQSTHNSKAGTVLLGKEQSTLGEKLTLAFGFKQLIISKKGKKLADIQYQHINQAALKNKKSLSAAISRLVSTKSCDSQSISRSPFWRSFDTEFLHHHLRIYLFPLFNEKITSFFF